MQFDAIWLAVMESLRALFPMEEKERAALISPQAFSMAYVTKMVKVPNLNVKAPAPATGM